ncbi:MAG TPA: hypothetical protein VK972_10200, partial [Wenzhouxiangella sp.]|nr:hypothetical protein [Wenzhouxiangella sp.]
MKNEIIPALRGLALCATLFASTALFAAEESGHYGLISVLPPIMAIALALILRQVVPDLFIGIWIGAWALHDFSLAGLWTGLLETFEIHIVDALADRDHAAVILFSMMVGGLVGIVS